MAVRPIISADNSHLRQRAKKVRSFSPALQTVVADMLETLEAANGLGLAAPQIDVSEQVVVIDLPEDDEDPQSGKSYVLVNPEIVRAQGAEEGEEGCLSVPGWWGLVTRATTVTVKAVDEHGRPFRLKGHGLLARALQHEIDHLHGVLFIDRVEGPEKLFRVEPEEPEEEMQEDDALALAAQ